MRCIFPLFLLLTILGLAMSTTPVSATDPCRNDKGEEICPHYNSFDDRVNYLDPVATMTAYCRSGALDVWLINGYDGQYAYSISAQDMSNGLARAISTQQPVVVGDGSALQVIALPGNAFKLHDGRTGYEFTFSASLCGITASASGVSAPGGGQPATAANAGDVKTTNIVKLRSTPQLGSRNVLGYVPRASVLTVLGRSADSQWLYIDFSGQKGWVAASFTTIRNRVLRALPIVTP